MTRKFLMVGLLVIGSQLYSISTVMNHRLVTSSPLLYKQIDYADPSLSLEIEPWVSGMFDPQHTMGNLGINGQSDMVLNQQGLGDIDPEWINLGSNTTANDYSSTINLTPELLMFGALVHFYKQWDNVFVDVRSAVINCRTQIKIAESGAMNGGGIPLPNGQPVYDAYDAFTQSDWNYGQFGQLTNKTGLDNVQLMLGGFGGVGSCQSCKSYLAGFVLVEAPTGHGTQAELLFEPQVGTNHWAVGGGLDYMAVGHSDFSLVVGGNYRYIFSNWETRSFDLTLNGQWSRYLELQSIAELGSGPVLGLPGINYFTQDALINGRSQVTAYARVQKRFQECLFELSYNFFYTQQETITELDAIPAGYGIYDVYNLGGVTTASTATIAQNNPVLDPLGSPVTLVTSDLNLASGAQSTWMSNTVAARLQRVNEHTTWGIGGSVDLAMSAQAISAWSVWFNFELLLPN